MATETKTTICNKALSLIGEDPISSYDSDTSIAGRACRTNFDLVMQSLLEEGYWTYPTVEEALVKIEDEEFFAEEQKYMYDIPKNCVLIQDVFHKDAREDADHRIKWDIRYIPELEKKVIIVPTDEDIYIEYLFSPENLSIFSATFLKALVDGLAYSICMEVTKDMQKTQLMLQLYEKDKADALRKSLNEDLKDEKYTSPFITCRG